MAGISHSPISLLIGRPIMDVALSATLARRCESLEPMRRVLKTDLARELSGDGIASCKRASVILLGARLSGGEPTALVVSKLRTRVPNTPIVVLTDDISELKVCAVDLARAGVDQAFCMTADSDWTALEQALGFHVGSPQPEIPFRVISEGLAANPERVLTLHLLRNSRALMDFAYRAEWFGTSERTVRDRMVHADLPKPSLLERFGIVMRGRFLMRHVSAELAAEIVGVGAAKGLARMRRNVEKGVQRWPLFGEALELSA